MCYFSRSLFQCSSEKSCKKHLPQQHMLYSSRRTFLLKFCVYRKCLHLQFTTYHIVKGWHWGITVILFYNPINHMHFTHNDHLQLISNSGTPKLFRGNRHDLPLDFRAFIKIHSIFTLTSALISKVFCCNGTDNKSVFAIFQTLIDFIIPSANDCPAQQKYSCQNTKYNNKTNR